MMAAAVTISRRGRATPESTTHHVHQFADPARERAHLVHGEAGGLRGPGFLGPVLDRSARGGDGRLQVVRERREQRRFHLVAGHGLLGLQLQSQQALALERQAHQDRRNPEPSGRSSASLERSAHPPARPRSGSADRGPGLPAGMPADSAVPCRKARSASRGRRRNRVPRFRGSKSPPGPASRIDTCCAWSATRNRSAVTSRRESRRVSETKAWESCVRLARSARSASTRRRRSRPTADKLPIRRPEIRKTTSAAAFCGSSIRKLWSGGKTK